MDECAFQGSVVVRREVSVSMCSFPFSSHKQLEASISLEAMSTHGTAHLLRKFVASQRCRARYMNFQSSVIRSEVLRGGSIDTYAVHCPRGQVFHVASLNFSFALLMGCFTDV